MCNCCNGNIPVERPKYWSSEDQCVIRGVETALNPLSAKSLCGKYYFVWEGHELKEELIPKEYGGWLKLTYKGDSKPEAGNLNHIHGSASFEHVTGSFKGLAVRREYARDNKGAEIPNSWALLRSTLRENAEPGDKDVEDTSDATGTDELTALEVRDDNGHPFVQFVYELGWSGCSPGCFVYIGKKQVGGGRPKGLTAAERSRLGMNMETEEVEEVMNEEGSEEEDSADIPVQSQPSGSSIARAMKRKAEEEEGEVPDGKPRPSVKPKLEHP